MDGLIYGCRGCHLAPGEAIIQLLSGGRGVRKLLDGKHESSTQSVSLLFQIGVPGIRLGTSKRKGS